MKLRPTPLDGMFIVERSMMRDARGKFTRLYGEDEIGLAGRPMKAVHVNSSTSTAAGTLRGLHFQYPPFAEAKLVSCLAGAVWDVGVDLRANSPTQFQWFGLELNTENGMSLLIPEGFAHGFVTLQPNTTLAYVVSERYAPDNESGVRFDDPLISVEWPMDPTVLSDKDGAWLPLGDRLDELESGFRNFLPGYMTRANSDSM